MSFLPSTGLGQFAFPVPLIVFLTLMAPKPRGSHGVVERALDKASGDPGPGLCLITTLLCDPGQVAKPLWLSVLLAKQRRVHQSQSFQVWGGLSASQDM